MGDEAQYNDSKTAEITYPERVTPRPLSEIQRSEESIARTRRIVNQKVPECVPFIKELFELGMIDGWRSVYAYENPVLVEAPEAEEYFMPVEEPDLFIIDESRF